MKVVSSVAALVFGSGFCALVYQTVWLRELRFIFGSSTPANAAALGLFMGGLGLGSVWLGRRAERAPRPLLLYARLELGVTAAAAASPWLLDLVRALYLWLGGSSSLGEGGATVVRLILAAFAMGAPAVLMGGTLPALARAVTSENDVGRRGLALLYGLNTVGAVLGVLLPTFLLFERLGFRRTLWLACLANLVLATVAWAIAREWEEPRPSERSEPKEKAPFDLQRTLLTASAFLVGFVFFVAELVWYRMSAPILGGTTYTFGLILACALLGIGIGGLLYALAPPARIGLGAVAVTCALEALLLVVPYAAGDEIATLAYHLRAWGALSFATLVVGWSLVAALLVLPAAVVAGYQLPLLIGAAGQAERGVARDVGDIYAANTAGAVLGSLLGGFVLVPTLTAPGSWTACVVLLATLAALLALLGRGDERLLRFAAVPLMVLALGLCLAPGPTALWRHTGIGVGRAVLDMTSTNDRRAFQTALDGVLLEEHEGSESSLAVIARDGLSINVNGKSDGNTRHDAPTAIGLAVLPAILHADPRRAFVVGLASGQTAGWLAAVPSMEHVDVAEIEPAMLRFAELAKDTNAGALTNPKVQVHIADGREALMTSGARYDIIASEPSNPYRAGVASLYTLEFYQSVRQHLNPGGYFAQWVQGYDIDARTLRVVLATTRAAFPFVSVWQLGTSDLLLLSSSDPQRFPADSLREHLPGEPFRDAFADIMGVYDVEGILSLHIASPRFVDEIVRGEPYLSTEDLPILELRFGRNIAQERAPLVRDVLGTAMTMMSYRPSVVGNVDWTRVEALRRRPYDLAMTPGLPSPHAPVASSADSFWDAYLGQGPRAAASYLPSLDPHNGDLYELTARAEVLAVQPEATDEYRAALAALEAAGKHTALAWLRLTRALEVGDEPAPLFTLIERAVRTLHEDPFPPSVLVLRGFDRLRRAPLSVPDRAAVAELLVLPFIGHNLPIPRWDVAFTLLGQLPPESMPTACVALFDQVVPFEEQRLRTRVECYRRHAPERLPAAQRDLQAFLDGEARTLRDLLLQPRSQERHAPG